MRMTDDETIQEALTFQQKVEESIELQRKKSEGDLDYKKALLYAFRHTFGGEYFHALTLILIGEIFTFFFVVFIGQLIDFIEDENAKASKGVWLMIVFSLATFFGQSFKNNGLFYL